MFCDEAPIPLLESRKVFAISLNQLYPFTVGIGDIKSPDLYSSFIGFNAIHLKFCNNMEITIPKKRMFSFFRFWHFSRENDVTKFPPNFVLYYGISNGGF